MVFTSCGKILSVCVFSHLFFCFVCLFFQYFVCLSKKATSLYTLRGGRVPSAWSFAIVLRSRNKSFPRNCASRSLKNFLSVSKVAFRFSKLERCKSRIGYRDKTVSLPLIGTVCLFVKVIFNFFCCWESYELITTGRPVYCSVHVICPLHYSFLLRPGLVASRSERKIRFRFGRTVCCFGLS